MRYLVYLLTSHFTALLQGPWPGAVSWPSDRTRGRAARRAPWARPATRRRSDRGKSEKRKRNGGRQRFVKGHGKRKEFFLPKQFTVGFSLRKKKAGRDMLWPRPRSLSALCPPCVCHVALWVRHESAPCLLSLSARCSLFICSLSAFVWVHGLSVAEPLSVCVCSLVFAPFSVQCPLLSAGILHDIRFLSVTRANANAILCLKNVWGLCWCNFSFFPKQFTVGFSLRRKRAGRDMLWPLPGACPPCARHCPPCVRRKAGTCPLWLRLQTFALCLPPNLVRLFFLSCVSSMRPFFVRRVPTLCQLRSTTSSPLNFARGAGPWHHELKFFLGAVQPTAFILHARWSASLAFILAPQIRPLQAHPMLEKLFGVYAGITFFLV